jgi:hypothetical protein
MDPLPPEVVAGIRDALGDSITFVFLVSAVIVLLAAGWGMHYMQSLLYLSRW